MINRVSLSRTNFSSSSSSSFSSSFSFFSSSSSFFFLVLPFLAASSYFFSFRYFNAFLSRNFPTHYKGIMVPSPSVSFCLSLSLPSPHFPLSSCLSVSCHSLYLPPSVPLLFLLILVPLLLCLILILILFLSLFLSLSPSPFHPLPSFHSPSDHLLWHLHRHWPTWNYRTLDFFHLLIKKDAEMVMIEEELGNKWEGGQNVCCASDCIKYTHNWNVFWL